MQYGGYVESMELVIEGISQSINKKGATKAFDNCLCLILINIKL